MIFSNWALLFRNCPRPSIPLLLPSHWFSLLSSTHQILSPFWDLSWSEIFLLFPQLASTHFFRCSVDNF